MYVSFHGVIFDPSTLVFAKRWDGDVALCFDARRGPNAVIHATEECTSEEIFEELFEVLQDAGLAAADPEPVDLTEAEAAMLRNAHAEHYNWIARDKDGKLFAYINHPQLAGAYWEDGDGLCAAKRMDKDDDGNPIFEWLDGEDEPVNIMELLLGE
jgi:hypothetical protein